MYKADLHTERYQALPLILLAFGSKTPTNKNKAGDIAAARKRLGRVHLHMSSKNAELQDMAGRSFAQNTSKPDFDHQPLLAER